MPLLAPVTRGILSSTKKSEVVPILPIPIELIGLRPGERLHEELVKEQGDLTPTSHEKVFMVQDRYFEPAQFHEDLEELRQFVSLRDRQRATEKLTIMAGRY